MIPGWNISGVLPPIRPGVPGHDQDRSPYKVNLLNVIDRFSTTMERCQILLGLLDYRAALHDANLVQGFQWLDGSFMEAIEIKELRAPNDVDVVSFFHMPENVTQAEFALEHGALFDSDNTKTLYKVDAYPAVLGEETDSIFVNQVAYWYSMWSHTREELWKGFLEIDLSPEYDEEAKLVLLEKINSGDFS